VLDGCSRVLRRERREMPANEFIILRRDFGPGFVPKDIGPWQTEVPAVRFVYEDVRPVREEPGNQFRLVLDNCPVILPLPDKFEFGLLELPDHSPE